MGSRWIRKNKQTNKQKRNTLISGLGLCFFFTVRNFDKNIEKNVS